MYEPTRVQSASERDRDAYRDRDSGGRPSRPSEEFDDWDDE